MATATMSRRIVREIPRIDIMSAAVTETFKQLLQVAAYARVST